MRLGLFAVVAIAVGFVAMPALSQSLPACSGIELIAPANGSHFMGTRPIMFSWSGEPVGTVSRELHLAGLDGSETVIPLDGRFSDTVRVKMTGDLAWVVVYLDAKGRPLCTSPAGLLTKGSGGGKLALSTDSLSGQSSGAGAPAKVSVFMNNGRLVIVLQNSSYAGQYTKLVNADSYDGSTEPLLGASGLEIHGNDQDNLLKGSSGADLIYAYAGADLVKGNAGQDVIHLGTAGATLDGVDIQDGEVDTVFAPGFVQIGGAHPSFPGELTSIDLALDPIGP